MIAKKEDQNHSSQRLYFNAHTPSAPKTHSTKIWSDHKLDWVCRLMKIFGEGESWAVPAAVLCFLCGFMYAWSPQLPRFVDWAKKYAPLNLEPIRTVLFILALQLVITACQNIKLKKLEKIKKNINWKLWMPYCFLEFILFQLSKIKTTAIKSIQRFIRRCKRDKSCWS